MAEYHWLMASAPVTVPNLDTVANLMLTGGKTPWIARVVRRRAAQGADLVKKVAPMMVELLSRMVCAPAGVPQAATAVEDQHTKPMAPRTVVSVMVTLHRSNRPPEGCFFLAALHTASKQFLRNLAHEE